MDCLNGFSLNHFSYIFSFCICTQDTHSTLFSFSSTTDHNLIPLALRSSLASLISLCSSAAASLQSLKVATL